VPAAEVPADSEERLRWLQDNWAEVDAWIGRHRPEPPRSPGVSPEVSAGDVSDAS
jgi:hypothetical protein